MKFDFKLKDINSIVGFSIYRQYITDAAMNSYFSFLKKRLYTLIEDRVRLLNSISYENNDLGTYIQFFYENLFGLQRTFGESRVKHAYDTGKKYDEGNLYDDVDFDGFLDLRYYKLLIKYLLDYSEESFTLGWLYAFVCEFCELEPNEVQIEEHYSYLVINIPNNIGGQILQNIFLDKKTYLNTPIEDIRFNLT